MAFFKFRRGYNPLDDSALLNAKEQGALIPFDPIGYTHFRVRKPIHELPGTPQVYVYSGQLQNGVGGLISGQVIFQPLQTNGKIPGYS